MDAIIKFFTSIIDVITSILSFVGDFIVQMFELATMLVEAAAAIPTLFAIFPPAATVALSAILAIAIAYKLLGRE